MPSPDDLLLNHTDAYNRLTPWPLDGVSSRLQQFAKAHTLRVFALVLFCGSILSIEFEKNNEN